MVKFVLSVIDWFNITKHNSVALVRERTIPTKRPPLVGEVRANVFRIQGIAWSMQQIPRGSHSDSYEICRLPICSPYIKQRFGRIYHFHLQGRKSVVEEFLTCCHCAPHTLQTISVEFIAEDVCSDVSNVIKHMKQALLACTVFSHKQFNCIHGYEPGTSHVITHFLWYVQVINPSTIYQAVRPEVTDLFMTSRSNQAYSSA
jgi:hypothetical protein